MPSGQDHHALFSEHRYAEAIVHLEQVAKLDVRGYAVLGICYLRVGRFSDAERPLGIASALGDQEAQVEYANLLRSSGRFVEALAPTPGSVIDSLSGVPGAPGPQEPDVWVLLQTLGHVGMLKDGHPVTFLLRGTVPLMVYLTLTPHHTRQEIQDDLYPDKDPGAASAYVRKSIQELRELLGHGAVLTEGPRNQSRYRLGPHLRVDLDFTRYLDVVGRGEAARALALYRGEFLPDSDESPWVLQRRDMARRGLDSVVQAELVTCRVRQDWLRIIGLTNQYLRVDPDAVGLHELRIEAVLQIGTSPDIGGFLTEPTSGVH